MALPQTADPDLEWDLSDLYQGFRDPQFAQDLAAAQERARRFRDRYLGQVSQLRPPEIAQGFQELESIRTGCDRLSAYPQLRFAADTRDGEAKRQLDRILEAVAEIENQVLFFTLELQQLPPGEFSHQIAHPSLAPYAHILSRLAQYRPHQLQESLEQILNQTQLTGRQAFIQLHQIHWGRQQFPPVATPEGPTATTEPELNALTRHGKPEVRLEAYRSVRRVLEDHNPLYGFILNTVIQDHRLESKRRHYESTLAKQLLADQVSMPVFEAVMDCTRDRFDLFQQYYRLKGRAMGRVIRVCDLYAPWQEETDPHIPYSEGVSLLMQALQEFSPAYAEQAKPFFERRWVDAQVRPGKRGGAFCAPIPGLHSYLLLSYTHSYDSVFTLAHELGHGIHFERIRDHQNYLNSDPPLVMAEIASTFNELLLLDYLLKQNRSNPDPSLTRSLLARQLEDQLNLLFRQSTISRLELELHQRAAQGSFDHEFINETWLRLYQDLCGDAVELLPEHQFDWARIGHIFFKPFYCYTYTLSFMVALVCYQHYQQQGKEFVPSYLHLLDLGGSASPEQALRQVGIDLGDPHTLSQALDYTESLIEHLEEVIDD